MIVDKITTGEGSYIHSLLSIITHLGIIGSFIFILFLSTLYSNLRFSGTISNLQDHIYNNKIYLIYRILTVTTVIVYCLFSSFFTWLPLWFAFGFFGLNFIKQDEKNL